ncbi:MULTISPECIES: succinylglutamate desuccinylase/aspartoacylase family protein [Vibrio]|uniref:succinylglutamate desuccinylase/aspartoacylase family protein n=1 Tax=Vibrio TaxID=662 RepID=UPI00031ECDFA|nr:MULTISPECIES: succinylglutamate desuccinylase/aspartoacylase family protein [Vibrio]MCF7503122.1 succinylglutamate desuccinylase/aspartoacylase family protein [Vibrio sp. L3-7]OED68346.1 deacylase [Vibrio splendidus ZS-139]TVU65855.1 succinylglutamate desuccinylase/aspartoacylase family protein [Vibrio atlanticus]TVU77720.1 succinylglutamate desuccinylase/aspartoacylase family protein [Vibrio tasmaniensis]
MKTEYLGDVLQGRQVIGSLNVEDLPVGEHQFWFQVTSDGLGQPKNMPVSVFKGSQDGPKLMVTAGIHGDELNGVLAAQQIVRDLVGKKLKGTVTVVPTVNLSGLLNHSRDFISSDPGSCPANLNRLFPGNAQGLAAERFVASLWDRLLKHNATFAVDLHTQTRGAVYPLYVFADYRIEQCLEMARLMQPDCVLNDPGDPGILETVWNRSGIPSITVEVGMGKFTQPEMIQRAVDGVVNMLSYYDMLESNEARISSNQPLPQMDWIEGNNVVSIRADIGGFVLPQVELLQSVEQDDLLAIQYDAFGNECRRYHAPSVGRVLSYNVDALREPGALVCRLLS